MGKPAPTDVQHVDYDDNNNDPVNEQPTYAPPTPSIPLLFSACSRRDIWLGLVPAIAISLAAGGIAPFMTHVIGQAFDAMASFTSASDPGASARLMHKINIVSLELVGLAVGQLALSSLMSSVWLWLGERIVMRLRQQVFLAVTSRDIEWFDLLGENKSADDENEESVGAGGLMAKFVRYVCPSTLAHSGRFLFVTNIAHCFIHHPLIETPMMFGLPSLSTWACSSNTHQHSSQPSFSHSCNPGH